MIQLDRMLRKVRISLSSTLFGLRPLSVFKTKSRTLIYPKVLSLRVAEYRVVRKTGWP